MSQALTHCWGRAKESVFKALTFWASSAIRNNCSDAAPSSQQASICYVPEHSWQCPLIRGPGQNSDCLKLQEQPCSMLCFSQIHPAVFCPSACLLVSILASYALAFQNFNFWNYSSASGPSVVFTRKECFSLRKRAHSAPGRPFHTDLPHVLFAHSSFSSVKASD